MSDESQKEKRQVRFRVRIPGRTEVVLIADEVIYDGKVLTFFLGDVVVGKVKDWLAWTIESS